MTSIPIEPGSVLGVLGAGQLGAMFAGAASRLGFRVAVWDPDPDAPAHRLATHSFAHPFTDQETFARFSDVVHVVTYEWENVPADLCQRLEERVPVRPASTILRVIQDRVAQKTFLADQGFLVPPFEALHNPDQLHRIIQRLGCPAVCKTATAGYDGKGQWKISSESDVLAVKATMRATARPGSSWIVESYVPFERELSMVVARGVDGATVVYPLAENMHEAGILRISLVPAAVPATVAKQAEELARNVVDRLQGVGVFCLELFQNAGGCLLINEVAPRPHNSGHYTLDACSLSQFEQQVRAVSGMPLGEVRLLSPAAMVNLIGEDAKTIETGSGCRVLLKSPDAHVHMYGKRTIRPGRKMGHVTFLADRLHTAQDKAAQLRQCLIDERQR
ncbi:MAG TPA: 5-(carboxyamino)imidazole ribonucleotide synthase [Nitrospira sp.]